MKGESSMLLNTRRSAYAILLVGLFLMLYGVSCASPSGSAPGSTRPAMREPTPPLIFTIPLATRSPEALEPASNIFLLPLANRDFEWLDPAPNILTLPFATRTPQAPEAALDAAKTVFDIENSSLVEEPVESIQPEEDRTPTRLVIPAIQLDAPVEMVGWLVKIRKGQQINIWDTPDHFAAGWLKTSAPVGAAGNTVLDGHHNIKGKVFRYLRNLEMGDIIVLYAAGQERIYRVDQKLILKEEDEPLEVRQANAQYISPTTDERLTLVTCWPPTGNSHRLIIVALPVPPSPVWTDCLADGFVTCTSNNR